MAIMDSPGARYQTEFKSNIQLRSSFESFCFSIVGDIEWYLEHRQNDWTPS